METLDAESLARDFRSCVDALPSPRVPLVRPIRREFSRRISSARPEQVLDFAARLIVLDLRIWAYEIVHFHRPTLRTLDVAIIESLGQGLADWASVDVFGCYLAGPAWVNRQIGDHDVHRWARSPDRWWRRTALVATVGLNTKTRGGYGDAPGTLAVCDRLADDRDDMVVKALSWALRTLANHDPEAVQHFLSTNHHRLAARIIRETRNKLTTGTKNPRKTPG
ncbi:MAG: DNA alkylation repair protein [Chloroflexota bacterium]|nr:DNA alkylation repair protein [Chloroflexota bacterium]